MEAVMKLTEGIDVSGFTIKAGKVSRGRFKEEVNLDIYLSGEGGAALLLYVKAFYGRWPHYYPWVELFGFRRNVSVGGSTVKYFDSVFEDTLLSLFGGALEPGGSIFVEYQEDWETRKQLERGFPPPVSRLGYKLLELGFTWFKDWYFPEGFLEGGMKIQGDKPVSDEERARHLERVKGEIKLFLERHHLESEEYVVRAIGRAREILRRL
ncbi:MAG: DUF1122 family protein [Candidatus Jordarchaeales archaeon]